MTYTVKGVQKYLESLNYKEVIFVEEQKGDCMFFDAINPNGVDVSIRADVEDGVNMDLWNIYECCDDYDWENIEEIHEMKRG